jgi:hypothetical protein
MASAIAATSLASSARTRSRGRGIGAKVIGGLGVALTAATVAAVVMSSGPQSSTAAASQAQAAPVYAAVAAQAPVMAPTQVAPVAKVAPPASIPAAATAADDKKECKVLPRRFFVTGTGTVHLRADGFVSRNVALSDVPQEVDLPQRRPMTGEVQQNIVVEGQASFILLTTDYDFKQGLRVNGASNFDIYWVPPANC